MKLAQFIKVNHTDIIDSWVNFASSMQPWADGLNHKELQDHVKQLLIEIAEDMETSQSKSEQSEKSKGNEPSGKLGEAGKSHASARLETGIDLVQLASEFRALRASVLSKWEEAKGTEPGEVTRFNEAIDEALANSISRYSETVNSTRDQFLAILSHDLRNPIGAISMAATLLRDPQITDREEIVDIIINSSKRMNRMVNDLLDLARTRLGSGIPITPKPMDLGALCQEIIQELQASNPEHHLVFESAGDLHGEWDSDRLAQVITNLATNALRYGSNIRPVSIAAQDQNQDVVLEVHNDGSPIPENAQKCIFEPMTRLQSEDRDREKNKDGLGLGLFITSEIVRSHGGEISVASTEEEGTTFKVKLPRNPPSNGPQTVQSDVFS
ncbi:sensor histidine kinase [Oligoflexus tunisiensis]|uniref:sensor histidine kinase n=1 Tax=Oligoflexus tunisiensis TaxID=708132 RepID=UPI00114CC0F8|nr:sensor histidine kinase [Oligoflexus tunisiensis]